MSQVCRMRSAAVAFPCWSAVLVVGALVGCEASSIDPYARQLQDPDTKVRRSAAATLVKAKQEARPAIPELAAALNDKDAEVRRLAIRALAQMGPDSASTLPALVQCLEDDESSVRLLAAMAIQTLDATETKHRSVLIDAMKKGEGGTIVALGKMGDKAAWAVPTLTLLLKDRRAGIRRIAAEALRDIGSAASSAEETLRQVEKEDPDDRVREAAKGTLEVIGKKEVMK